MTRHSEAIAKTIDTKAIAKTIDAKTARGMGWALSWRLATRLLGLGSTLVLVRVLAPADFGLVALATGISNAVEQFGWLGVEAAIVREAAPGREVYDTGFTINVVRSVLLAAVIAAAAGPAAAFFGEPRLREVLLFLAAASACMGLENIGVVDFRRDFAFDREFRYLLAPRVLSILLAIGAALLLRSYWALVVMIVSSRVLRVGASYVMHPFRPRLSLRAWRVLAGTSTWMWLLGIASLLRDRGDTMVVGRTLSAAAVGLYSIGFEFAALTFAEVVEALQRPAFSGFVAARNQGVPLRQPLARMLGSVCLVSIPLGVGMSLVADPAIRLVAGARWAEAAPVVQILAGAGVFVAAGSLCRTLLTATGRFRTVACVTVGMGVLRIAALVAGIQLMGLPGAALAAGGTMALEAVVFAAAVCRHERMTVAEAAGPVWRPALAALAMGAALWAAGLGWAPVAAERTGAVALELAAAVLGGGAVYASVVFALWLACGRPAGAEADAIRLGRSLLARSVLARGGG